MNKSAEQYDAIQRHLTRKYGLKWWKNGHHDIDHLRAKWAEENSRQNTKAKESFTNESN